MRILLCTLLLLIGSSPIQAQNEQINISQMQFYNLGVKIGRLQSIEQIPLLYAPAKVVVPPSQEFIVSAPQAGLISKLNAAVGDRVEKDQVLAHINSPELLTLQRQFLKAGSEHRLAWLAYQRDKKLLREGVIADRRWQETRSLYSSKVSELNEAKQLLEIAGMSKADIDSLQKNRHLSSQLNVRSPITGVVLERMVVAGERLDILEPLYRIANLNLLWLEINIPQERVGLIKVGDQVLVEGGEVRAKISMLGQSVNPDNQTVLARAVIDNNRRKIRAGQTVNTQIIQAAAGQSAYKVPNVAIAQNEGQAYVFVRNDDGFVATPVTVIGRQDEDSVISGPLTGREEIAVRGAVALKANWLGLGEDE
ncbi:efflux RND transporter periplasmic adaptor subunit [Methylomarinum sp. Ch1-1]|uniref:Efflux RND transporter periplasmic adaptor subunit n=1 Tax=Methylomarinum roseum TaxID=3067653 RepID=A0AAU7NWE8_9GAMM|nr:efflux RND transporter periplasmic adaptor subunit [Methylomarinum sp. Ch1-1]MDP4522602.1 efflux RND transporter periplasmic adaptor subunit [Methylomarinum sp. Ch1-1]